HSKHARRHAVRHARHVARHARHVRRVRKYGIEQGARYFGEEVGGIGRRFGARAERKEDYGTVNRLVFSTIFSVVALFFLVWLLGLASVYSGNGILAGIFSFIMKNLGLFVLLFVLSAFTGWLARCPGRLCSLLLIPFEAISGTAVVWFLANIAFVINTAAGLPSISQLMKGLTNHIDMVFVVFVFIEILRFGKKLRRYEKTEMKKEGIVMKRNAKETHEIRRLYRSGKDKILGGVCGGIAEYLGIDPIIVRLLWVLFVLAGGSGLLAYIIAWIIIPRNPDHKWK
ncbi:MAG: PspC domain-containing protein, partial [Candidatus Aenigmatarchaeota archaeon]